MPGVRQLTAENDILRSQVATLRAAVFALEARIGAASAPASAPPPAHRHCWHQAAQDLARHTQTHGCCWCGHREIRRQGIAHGPHNPTAGRVYDVGWMTHE